MTGSHAVHFLGAALSVIGTSATLAMGAVGPSAIDLLVARARRLAPRLRNACLAAILAFGTTGCGDARPPQGPHDHAAVRGALILEALAETPEGVALRVSEGDTLRTGDRLWFRVSTERPAYVYVIQVFPNGTAELLYPEHGDLLLQAGEARRIPTDPRQHFVLDARPGVEHVLMIATPTQLEQSDSLLADLVGVVKRKRKWPSDIPLQTEGTGTSMSVAEGTTGEARKPGDHSTRAEPPTGASPRRPRQQPATVAPGNASIPSPHGTRPEGFLNLLGPNRSLERGLRLRTDPSRLQVVPDEAGIAVSLFQFNHRP